MAPRGSGSRAANIFVLKTLAVAPPRFSIASMTSVSARVWRSRCRSCLVSCVSALLLALLALYAVQADRCRRDVFNADEGVWQMDRFMGYQLYLSHRGEHPWHTDGGAIFLSRQYLNATGNSSEQTKIWKHGAAYRFEGNRRLWNKHYGSTLWQLDQVAFARGICQGLVKEPRCTGRTTYPVCCKQLCWENDCIVWSWRTDRYRAGVPGNTHECWLGFTNQTTCSDPDDHEMWFCPFGGSRRGAELIVVALAVCLACPWFCALYCFVCFCTRLSWTKASSCIGRLFELGRRVPKFGWSFGRSLGRPATSRFGPEICAARVDVALTAGRYTYPLLLLWASVHLHRCQEVLFYDKVKSNGLAKYLLDSDVSVALLWFFFASCAFWRPRWVTVRLLDAANVASGVVMFTKYMSLTQDDLFYNMSWMVFLRIAISLMCGNIRLVCVIQCLLIPCNLWTYLSLADEDQMPSVWTEHEVTARAAYEFYAKGFGWRVLQMTLVQSFFVVMLSWIVEVSLRRQVIATEIAKEAIQEAKATDESFRLVHRLLDSMCDAVVLLDANLRLVQEDAKLSNLLMRSQPLSAGFHFPDAIAADDVQNVLDCLAREERNDQRDGLSNTCVVHVLSSYSRTVKLRLFASCVGSDTGPRYLLGFAEAEIGEDWFGAGAHGFHAGMPVEHAIDEHAGAGEVSTMGCPGGGQASSDASNESLGGDSAASESTGDDDELSLVVATSGDLQIQNLSLELRRRLSSAATSIGGSLAASSTSDVGFGNWLLSSDFNDFQNWLLRVLGSKSAAGGDAGDAVRCEYPIALKIYPLCTRRLWRVTAVIGEPVHRVLLVLKRHKRRERRCAFVEETSSRSPTGRAGEPHVIATASPEVAKMPSEDIARVTGLVAQLVTTYGHRSRQEDSDDAATI